MKRRYTHIDCFAGPGGICTGLHASGIDTLVAIEYIKSCCDTYSANHPEVHVINKDIRDVSENEIMPYIPEDGIDIVTSGMPCETFSTAGNSSRSFYDDRQVLYRQGIRIAKICNAKLILFENVPGIMSKTIKKDSNKLVVEMIREELKEAGYRNQLQIVLDADRFGVPQKRKRFFLLAARDERWWLTEPQPTTWKAVTVEEALAGLPDVIPNTDHENRIYTGKESLFSLKMKDDIFWHRESLNYQGLIYNQMPMRHRKSTLKRFALLKEGESLKTLFEKYQGKEREALQNQRILPKKMFIKRNYRLRLDMPSPTVTSHCLDEFVHPTHDRALTVRECARLQSFPDSYNFVGGPYIVPHIDRSVQDKYEQIGDAVPPLLAYAWGKNIINILDSNLKYEQH